jgi:hypothetical protein
VADVFAIPQLAERILPRQKAQCQAAEEFEREEAAKAKHEEVAKVGAETSASSISRLLEVTLHDSQTKILITQTNVPLPSVSTVIVFSGTLASSRETVQSQIVPTITSLSSIGMSLETDESGFHLVFHYI